MVGRRGGGTRGPRRGSWGELDDGGVALTRRREIRSHSRRARPRRNSWLVVTTGVAKTVIGRA